MSNQQAPFRYDIVGSFLRKQELKQAREQYAAGTLSAAALKEVEVEHFSIAFQGRQPKSQTLKIVDKVDFPEDHPFLTHFRFLREIARDDVAAKQCIPSPSMLHLIC